MATNIPTVPAPSVGEHARGGVRWRWWLEKDADEAGRGAIAKAAIIERNQQSRFDELVVYGSLYAGRPIGSLYQFGSSAADASRVLGGPAWDVFGHRVTWNVAQSCVDTAMAKIAKNKTRVLFQTFDGNFTQKRRAKGLTKFVDGAFYETNFYDDISQPCFKDASIFDGGVAKIFVDEDNKIAAERVFPWEILVDTIEAMYGKPRTLYQRKFVPRDVLREHFARGKDKERTADTIEAAPSATQTPIGPRGLEDTSDMVPIYEGWRLRTGAEPGRHVIAINGKTLLYEAYDKDYFPFAVFTWDPLPTGFWGVSIVAQLIGIQIEINKILRVIQRAQHLQCVPRWWVPVGSNVVDEHISNELGGFLKYAGTQRPEPFVAPAVPPELYQWARDLYEKAFEITGITALSATGAKPAGLDAGVALREYHDIESERFVVMGQRFEQFHLDAAKIMIDLARDLAKRGKPVTMRALGTKNIEQVDWKDVHLDEDAYVMRAFPASILPATPAGRLQRVQELVDAQLIPREHALALLDMPDLEGAMSLQVSGYRDVERVIEDIIEHGIYHTPEPFMDLALAVKMGQSAFLRADADGVPGERLDKLARFIDEADALQKALAPPPAAPALPPMGAPGMAPGPMAGAPPPLPPEAGTPALPSVLPV